MKTTNYRDTFIAVAEDCPVQAAELPPQRSAKTVARMQYEMLAGRPYEYTSDDVMFAVHAETRGIAPQERQAERETFFAKGRACLRSSPLVKRYGWGLHHDAEGRVALVAVESDAYRRLANDDGLKQLKGMRSSRG